MSLPIFPSPIFPSLDYILERFDYHTGGQFGVGAERIEKHKLKFEYVSISYNPPVVREGKVFRISSQTLTNNSDKEQVLPFEWQYDYRNSFSWTLPTVLNAGITVEATVEVPPIAGGRIPPTMKLNLSTAGEQTISETKLWKVETTVKVPPNQRVLCESVITSSVAEVHFLAAVLISEYATYVYRGPIDHHIEKILSSVEDIDGNVEGWIPISTNKERGILGYVSGIVKGVFGKSIVTQYTELPLESTPDSASKDAPLGVRIVPESLQGIPEVLDRLSHNPSEKLKKLFQK